MRITVIGLNPALQKSLRIPPLNPGKVHRAFASPLLTIGGKGQNCAYALEQLSLLYSTPNVDLALHQFDECDSSPLSTLWPNLENLAIVSTLTNNPVRTCTTLVQPEGISTEIVEPTSPVTDALLDSFLSSLQPTDFLVMMGSIPPNAGDDIYGRCVSKSRPTIAIIDTTSRLMLSHVCTSAAHDTQVILKCNVDELLSMTDSPTDLNSTIDLIMKTSPKLTAILLTNGPNPAVCAIRDQPMATIPLPKISGRVKNPIGAGDAVAAGVAFKLAQNDESILDAFTFALRVGAAACLARLPPRSAPGGV